MKNIFLTLPFLFGCMQTKPEEIKAQECVSEKKNVEIPNWDDPIFKNWCPEGPPCCNLER